MSDVYSFRSGPTYRGASRQEMFDAAMEQPLSLTSTLMDQAKGGVLESFGLGTALRDTFTPEGNTESGWGRAAVAAVPLAGPVYEGFRGLAQSQINDEQPSLTEDQYKASPAFRENIPFDPGMTEQRAAALASMYDAKRVREFYAEKRPFAAFIGNIAGQALDPINYVPVAGPMVKAAAVARMGKVAGTAVFSALDAAANTAVFAVGTASERAKFGDDVSWQSTVSQIATAALIGSAFGALGGAAGRRVHARVRLEAETRLGTLRTVQESRIALNEGIDALVRGEDVRLSPNSTEPMARIADEVANLSRAYDEVRANPTGDPLDPLVAITPEDIEGTFVSRGAFKDVNQAEFSKRGWGLVKIIWRHGEESAEPEGFKVAKDDVVALPNVIREYEPSSVSADGSQREWRVERDGRTVVYADSTLPGGRHVVTAYIQKPNAPGAEAPLSGKRKPVATGSPDEPLKPVGDTTLEALPSPERGQSLPANPNIAQRPAINNSTARPEPAPEGIKQAEAAVAKTEDAKALASQYRVDPQTGSFHEEAELSQLAVEGRFTEQDAATMVRAQTDYEEGAAYAEALRAVSGCLI